MPEPRYSSSLGPPQASTISYPSFALSPAGPDRPQDDYLIRDSTLTVSIVVQDMDIPGFSIQKLQRAAVDLYDDLIPTTHDSALLHLLERFFLQWTASPISSTFTPVSFAAVG